MTKLDMLLARKSKLNEFYSSLSKEDLNRVDPITGTSVMSFLAFAIMEEDQKIEMAIARVRLNEYLDMDENFEKEVLK